MIFCQPGIEAARLAKLDSPAMASRFIFVTFLKNSIVIYTIIHFCS